MYYFDDLEKIENILSTDEGKYLLTDGFLLFKKISEKEFDQIYINKINISVKLETREE